MLIVILGIIAFVLIAYLVGFLFYPQATSHEQRLRKGIWTSLIICGITVGGVLINEYIEKRRYEKEKEETITKNNERLKQLEAERKANESQYKEAEQSSQPAPPPSSQEFTKALCGPDIFWNMAQSYPISIQFSPDGTFMCIQHGMQTVAQQGGWSYDQATGNLELAWPGEEQIKTTFMSKTDKWDEITFTSSLKLNYENTLSKRKLLDDRFTKKESRPKRRDEKDIPTADELDER